MKNKLEFELFLLIVAIMVGTNYIQQDAIKHGVGGYVLTSPAYSTAVWQWNDKTNTCPKN